MISNKVEITSNAIEKTLKNYTKEQAIAEFVWNGFDAKSNVVDIRYKTNEFNSFVAFSIEDYGIGIDMQRLPEKFHSFNQSEKAIEISAPKHTSIMHGKNGVGRFTFFKFSTEAQWDTAYKDENGIIKCGLITISKNKGLNTISSDQKDNNKQQTGTLVSFNNIDLFKEEFDKIIIPYLKDEFGWFLELNKSKNYCIKINGEILDYSDIIADKEENKSFEYKDTNTQFTFSYVQWKNPLHKEFSKYYFINGDDNEMYKDYTTLNKKGDTFFHSCYIKSDLFDNFDFKQEENSKQISVWAAKNTPEYKFLIKAVNEFLNQKRKGFLKQYTNDLIEKYEKDNVLPTYSNEWEEKYKKPQLEETIKELYVVQPKIFTSLNVEQKKTFVRLLDLVLDSNERDNLLKIVEEVVSLTSEERKSLVSLFNVTRLNRIISTIKLIEERYKTVETLKDLVFNEDLKANEVNHLQSMIESHYWIFGEQYHLVTAAEPKFEEALRRHHYLLYQEDKEFFIDHPDKMKEMDIFACRQNFHTNTIDNIVIELKHPRVNLGEKQFSQVRKYMDVIIKQSETNANNINWEFYLVGKQFDSTDYIKDQIETNKPHGLRSLALWKNDGQVKIFVKTWSEVFAEFELKHKFLMDKLKFDREQLLSHANSAQEAVNAVVNNSAKQPSQVIVPND